MAHLRHKESGDLKEVLTDSAEYHKLAGERTDDGKPVYEDAGVRAHAELGIAPADLSGINDRNDDEPEWADDPAPDERERHANYSTEKKDKPANGTKAPAAKTAAA